MSEPITIYAVVAQAWDNRFFEHGEAMTLASPSLVRDLLATRMWSAVPPLPPLIRPPMPEQPVTPKPTPKRRGKGK